MRHLTHRSDGNQQAIIDALRLVGATVVDLQNVGKGCPDLLIGYRGQTILLEVKTETGKLNQLQKNFEAGWRGGKLTVVRSVDEALQSIGVEI